MRVGRGHGTGDDPNAQLFSTKEQWQAALAAARISKDIQLLDPDVVAKTVPGQVLRPWDYHYMRGLFGLSDDAWCGITLLVGLAAAFAIGAIRRFRRYIMVWAVGLGLFVDFVAMIILAGEGPGAFVGLFMYPLFFMLAAHLSRGIRGLVEYVIVKCRGRQHEPTHAQ